MVLLIALLQYLFAPKVAEAMRQRAIMLCRAFTSTESQGMSMQVCTFQPRFPFMQQYLNVKALLGGISRE